MKSILIAIGNSRGIRIPKLLMDQTGLTGEVELVARDGDLFVRNAAGPRARWAEAFRAMAANGDDRLIDKPPGPGRA